MNAPAAIPWAAVCALLISCLLDRNLYDRESLWRWLDSRLAPSNMLEIGLVQDRIALLNTEDAGEVPRVVVVGSSRLNVGFRPDLVPADRLPRMRFTKLTHPQFFAFEIRAAVDEILSLDPHFVILGYSEIETFTPLQFIPGASFGDLGAIAELARIAGPRFVTERHVMLARIALDGIFDTYHYRRVLGRAGLDELRTFDHDRRLKRMRRPERSSVYHDGERKEIAREDLTRIVEEFDARFPGRGSIIGRSQFGLLRSVTPGRHSDIHLALSEQSIEVLRAGGVEVVLVEPPIYPGARALYDSSLRGQFLNFAERLVRDHGVHFVPLDDQPEYGDEDFVDLTHMGRSGVLKFTEAVLEALPDGLDSPAPANPTRR